MKSQTSDLEGNSSDGAAIAGRACDAISLNSCPQFEWIIVKTQRSVYELVVLSGKDGSVLVRGGRLFPEFRRATVGGSVIGSAAVKLASIVAGLHLELVVDGKSFVTSRIEAAWRRDFAGEKAA